MRWKLIVITTLVISLISAGLQITLLRLLFGCSFYLNCTAAAGQTSKFDLLSILTLVLSFMAAFFVYRHTARRRKLQAVMTFIFSILLTITFYFLYMVYTLRTIKVY